MPRWWSRYEVVRLVAEQNLRCGRVSTRVASYPFRWIAEAAGWFSAVRRDSSGGEVIIAVRPTDVPPTYWDDHYPIEPGLAAP